MVAYFGVGPYLIGSPRRPRHLRVATPIYTKRLAHGWEVSKVFEASHMMATSSWPLWRIHVWGTWGTRDKSWGEAPEPIPRIKPRTGHPNHQQCTNGAKLDSHKEDESNGKWKIFPQVIVFVNRQWWNKLRIFLIPLSKMLVAYIPLKCLNTRAMTLYFLAFYMISSVFC
jgi:hypothetical protein